MKKKLKSPWFWLVVALLLCFISMIGTSCMQTNWGKTDVDVLTGTLSEIAGMIRENNEAYDKDIQITFTEDSTYSFSFMTLIPSNATADNPVPAIVCSHGAFNTKEMQLSSYLELARRGFVVATIDMSGHGYSDNAIDSFTGGSMGMVAAVEYVMSLPCVDESQVGITGHSMGNQAAFGTLQQLNVEGSTQRISAWVGGGGTRVVVNMTPEYMKDLLWTISIAKYDETDTELFESYNILTNDYGKEMVTWTYPEFSDDAVVEGQWYTPDGPIDSPAPGEKLPVKQGFCMYSPHITHPQFYFSSIGTEIVVNGFYNAYGTPSGAEYISSDNQVWQFAVAFELIGLIGFFMMLFPLVSLLSRTRLFANVVRKETTAETLPALKNPREWITLVVTCVILIAFSFVTYYKLFPKGDRYLDASVYAGGIVSNGIGLWSLVCGVFVVIVIIVVFAVKWLLYRKSAQKLVNPFAPAAMSSVSQFLLTVVFAFSVVIIMFIPVYIARYVFAADFRICSFVIYAPTLDSIPLAILKYAPLWFAFYIPNAIMNANTRYRDVPNWLTTTICAVVNCAAVVIFEYIQYSKVLNEDHLWHPECSMAGIVGFAVIPCLFYAAYSARYIYNRTRNAWAAGMINGTVMCCVTLFSTWYSTDFLLNF